MITRHKYNADVPSDHAIILQLIGYWKCLCDYGKYTNGIQYVGELNIHIREALENEILRYFTPDSSDKVLKIILNIPKE